MENRQREEGEEEKEKQRDSERRFSTSEVRSFFSFSLHFNVLYPDDSCDNQMLQRYPPVIAHKFELFVDSEEC